MNERSSKPAAAIKTFDHCGFPVDDIPRAQRFYQRVLGGKPVATANLNNYHGVYQGWPIISFVEMGGHRFELCLAQEPLPPADNNALLRIGFSVTQEMMLQLRTELGEAGVTYEGPLTYPQAVPIKETLRTHDPEGNVIEFSVRR